MNMAPEWSAAVLAWPALIALSIIFGSSILSLLVQSRSEDRPHAAEDFAGRLSPWWRLCSIVAFLFSPLLLLNQVARMAEVSWRGALPFVCDVLKETYAGHVWDWQMPVAFVLLIVAWTPLAGFAKPLLLCILSAAILLLDSLTSHAIDYGGATIALHTVHALAAGLWVGALFGWWIGWRGVTVESEHAVRFTAILSRLAAWSVLIAVLSGIFLAYEGLGFSLHNFFYSTYSHVLAVKIGVFGLVLLGGAYNRYFLLPKLEEIPARQALRRNVGLEWAVLFGVLGLAAVLANTSPARMALRAQAGGMPAGREAFIISPSLCIRFSQLLNGFHNEYSI
jgi:putative copper resistance protein D